MALAAAGARGDAATRPGPPSGNAVKKIIIEPYSPLASAIALLNVPDRCSEAAYQNNCAAFTEAPV